MKDFENMRKYLQKEQPVYISNNETFDITEMEMLKELYLIGNKADFKKCFERANENNNCQYKVQYKCSKCGKIVWKTLTKTKLFDFIIFLSGKTQKGLFVETICEECEKEQKRQKEENYKKEQEKYKDIIEENTKDFISIYLNPNHRWKKGVAGKIKTDFVIRNGYNIDNDKVYEYIQELEYEDFIKTPYWQAISLYAKSKAGFKCALCGNTENLRTHHKTYHRHGYEHIPKVIKEDLIVLCNECHEKFHDIY